MISGQVNARTEPVIRVTVRGLAGREVAVDAIVDTGFSGHLSLPRSTVAELQLAYSTSRAYSLGDNTPVNFDIYEAEVEWDGCERDVLVLASEAHPLVGMSLLKGFCLSLDAVDGGDVHIRSLR